MSYYGFSDRVSLLSALRHLHEESDTMLCRNTLLALSSGRIYGIAHMPGLVGDDANYYEGLERGRPASFAITVPAGAATGVAHGHGMPAHLPFGFRVVRASSPYHVVLPCAYRPPSDYDKRAVGRKPSRIRTWRAGVPRTCLTQCTAEEFADRVIGSMLVDEDNTCTAAFDDLPFCSEAYDPRAERPLQSLRRFVMGVNRGHGTPLGLDTVFTSLALFSELAGGHAARPGQGAPNILDCGGMRILAHSRLPKDVMTVMSRARGPVFVDGPVTLTCHMDHIDIRRYCEAVMPLGGYPRGMPGGFRVEVLDA